MLWSANGQIITSNRQSGHREKWLIAQMKGEGARVWRDRPNDGCVGGAVFSRVYLVLKSMTGPIELNRIMYRSHLLFKTAGHFRNGANL